MYDDVAPEARIGASVTSSRPLDKKLEPNGPGPADAFTTGAPIAPPAITGNTLIRLAVSSDTAIKLPFGWTLKRC